MINCSKMCFNLFQIIETMFSVDEKPDIDEECDYCGESEKCSAEKYI